MAGKPIKTGALYKCGHPCTPENTYQVNGKRPYRGCLTCKRANKRKFDEEQNSLPPETESVMAAFKDPLTPVPQGYGYYGTLAYDKEKKYTQCHLCGRFYFKLGAHVYNVHNTKARDYREQFGLPPSLSLTPPNAKNDRYERWAKMTPEERKTTIKRMVKARKGGPQKNKKWSLHHRNIQGRCPEQLLSKILDVKEKVGQTPTLEDFVKVYGWGHYSSIKTTYGSWTEALNILNLQPRPRSHGHKAYDRELLVKLLLDFKQHNGREPMTSDMVRGILPSPQVFRKHFGSIAKAKEYVK